MRAFCAPRSLEADRRVIAQNLPELRNGNSYLSRTPDGRLVAFHHHETLDTLKDLEEHVRSGGSTRDSLEFLQAESEQGRDTVTGALLDLGDTVAHPVTKARAAAEHIRSSGPALVEFSRRSADIVRDRARAGLHNLTSGSPRQAGKAWGAMLGNTGIALAPFPSLTKITGLAGASRKVLQYLRPLENTKLYRIGEATAGGRNGFALRPVEKKAVLSYINEHYATPKGGIHFRKIGHTEYAAGSLDALKIGPDVLPKPGAGTGTLSANSRVSLRGCIAHELEGHRRAALANRTQPIHCLEEAQASIRAARFGKALTRQERTTLLRDAISRLHNGGYKVRDVKKILWIEKP